MIPGHIGLDHHRHAFFLSLGQRLGHDKIRWSVAWNMEAGNMDSNPASTITSGMDLGKLPSLSESQIFHISCS